MDNSWKNLELAILIAGNRHPQCGDPYYMEQSVNLINTVRSDPQGWKSALDVFLNSNEIIAKYTSLDILIGWVRYGDYKNEDVSIHKTLHDRLHSVLFDHKSTLYDTSQTIVIKKFCVFLCMLLQYDYPTIWKDPFNELYQFCHKSETECSLYIYLLTYINEEIGYSQNSDMYRSIKDCLRKQGLEDIWNHLITLLYNYYSQSTSLSCLILHCIETYLSWIPNKYIFSSQCLQLLFTLLSYNDYQISIVKCIIQIIDKGMNVEEKIRIIQSLDLLSVYNTVVSSNSELIKQVNLDQSCDDTILYCISDLINIVGYELYQLYSLIYNTEYQESYLSLLTLFYSLASSFVSLIQIYPSPYVYSILEVMIEYSNLYHHQLHPLYSIYPQVQQYQSILFKTLFNEIQLPKDFNISNDISINGDIYDYQNKVYKLLQTIIKSIKDDFIQDLELRFHQLEQYFQLSSSFNNTQFDWRYIEALYHTVYYLGDSSYKDHIKPFVLHILSLYSTYSKYPIHNHICIISILQEIVYRFTSLIVLHEDLYTPSSLLYIYGIQYTQDESIQKRSAYLLNKFIHRIYIKDPLLSNIPFTIIPSYPTLPSCDSFEYLYILYEILSYLMFVTNKFDFHKKYISGLIQCTVACINDTKHNSNYLVFTIECLIAILSGLQTLNSRQIENSDVPVPPQPDIAPLLYYLHDEFIQVNTMITSLSSIYIYNIEIYSVIINLLKIYIQIMHKDVIPLLPSLCSYLFGLPTDPNSSLYLPHTSPIPISTNSSKSYLNGSLILLPPLLCLQLLSQIVGQYRKDTYDSMVTLLPSLTSYITTHFKNLQEDLDHQVLQQFYQFLSLIISIYPSIFFTDASISSLEDYFSFFFKGLSNGISIGISKDCLQLYKRLIKGFTSLQNTEQRSFATTRLSNHLQKVVLPYLSTSNIYSSYKEDPSTIGLIIEISSLYISISSSLPQVKEYILTVMIPSLHLPQDLSLLFSNLFDKGENRPLQKVVKQVYKWLDSNNH